MAEECWRDGKARVCVDGYAVAVEYASVEGRYGGADVTVRVYLDPQVVLRAAAKALRRVFDGCSDAQRIISEACGVRR